MDKITLAIVDSGYGGISILNTLYQINGTKLQAVGFADQKNVPYGNREAADIIDIMTKNIQWLQKQGIEEVLLACNTTSALALDNLRLAFPSLKFTGIIDMTAQMLENQELDQVLVLATAATVKSQCYRQSLIKFKAANGIVEQALPDLVDMIESTAAESEIAKYLEAELADCRTKYDAIILGCTHYVLVKELIKDICCCDNIIDSNAAIRDFANSLPKLASQVKIYTTGDAETLRRQQFEMFGSDFPVEAVSL